DAPTPPGWTTCWPGCGACCSAGARCATSRRSRSATCRRRAHPPPLGHAEKTGWRERGYFLAALSPYLYVHAAREPSRESHEVLATAASARAGPTCETLAAPRKALQAKGQITAISAERR